MVDIEAAVESIHIDTCENQWTKIAHRRINSPIKPENPAGSNHAIPVNVTGSPACQNQA
jgi:hypothetical protein